MFTETLNSAERVHEIISRHMLADGFKFVLDLKNSNRNKLIDELTGESYIDFFTFFASSPLGFNHPKLTSEETKNLLVEAAINKPSISRSFLVANLPNSNKPGVYPTQMLHP